MIRLYLKFTYSLTEVLHWFLRVMFYVIFVLSNRVFGNSSCGFHYVQLVLFMAFQLRIVCLQIFYNFSNGSISFICRKFVSLVQRKWYPPTFCSSANRNDNDDDSTPQLYVPLRLYNNNNNNDNYRDNIDNYRDNIDNYRNNIN
jgi:hypothetical protein